MNSHSRPNVCCGPLERSNNLLEMNFPYIHETKELNESTRKELPGAFIPLTDGMTHYELSGDESQTLVVMIHGFSVPYFIFDNTTEFLVNSGFRVLRYDLYGRGFSDRPHTKYEMSLYVRQLKDLLDGLDLKNAVVLGLSMGGPISAAFIDQYPDYANKHVMIDPSGARPIAFSALLKVAATPGVGELLLGLFGSESMIKGAASDMFAPKLVEEFQEKYKVQMQYQGFMRAILSSMRSGMLGSCLDTYRQVGKLKKPTLLFWGRQDATVPFEQSADITSAIPHTEFHAIENCGHIPHFEKPEEVHPILLEFLKR